MITLGLDCGTQSTKTIALDSESGAILAQAAAATALIPGLPEGHLEQHPADWLAALEQTIGEVLHQLGERRDEVAALGVSGQQHGFVPLDAAREVIRPAKLWCDTSTVAECAAFREHFGGSAALLALAGNDMLPGFTAPKILWLKRHEPENFARLRHVLLPHDFLNFYLTGNLGMEYGDASGTALLDIRTRTWSSPLVDFIDTALGDFLPPVGSSLRPAGTLRPDLAKRWGLRAGVVISAGGGDNMMSAIGTGNVRSGGLTASLGTSGTIYGCAAAPTVDPRGEIAAFCDSADQWLPLLCTMNVTVATEQVRALFDWDHAALEAAVQKIPPGAEGLTFLPYLQGERTPNLPRGSGVLHGLTPRNFTPGHLARAVFEGVTLGLAYGLQRLRELGLCPSEIRLTGGGSQSATWRQLCADIFAVPCVTLSSAEGAALGAALQALAAVQTGAVQTGAVQTGAVQAGAVQAGATLAALADRLVTVDETTRCLPQSPDDYAPQLARQQALTAALVEKGFL